MKTLIARPPWPWPAQAQAQAPLTPSTRRTPSSTSKSATSAPPPTAAASTTRKARCTSTAPPRPARSRSSSTSPRSTPAWTLRPAHPEQGLLQRRRIPHRQVRGRQVRLQRRQGQRGAGKLTLKGKTHPVVLKATKFNCYVNPMFKREVCGGDFETTIQRSQWGIIWGLHFGFAGQRAPADPGRSRQAVRSRPRPARRRQHCCQHARHETAAALAAGLLAAAAAGAGPARGLPARPAHSFVHFEVLHFGTSTLRGRFGPIDGEVELDRAARSGRVQLRIDTAAVDTGLRGLRRPPAPEPTCWPARPTRWPASWPSALVSTGRRSVRCAASSRCAAWARALELRAQRFGCYTHPLLQREVCGGDFEGELERATSAPASAALRGRPGAAAGAGGGHPAVAAQGPAVPALGHSRTRPPARSAHDTEATCTAPAAATGRWPGTGTAGRSRSPGCP